MKVLAAILVVIASLADSLVFWWFMVIGLMQLWHDHYFEASALICAAVFWQRFEKMKMLEKLEKKVKP